MMRPTLGLIWYLGSTPTNLFLKTGKTSIPKEYWSSYVCDLDTIDISTILQSCDHDRFLPTPVPGAFRKRWILPRPKNTPPACFLNGLSNPARPSKKFHPIWGGTFLSRLDTIDVNHRTRIRPPNICKI